MTDQLGTYQRAKLRPGLSYPLGQTQIVEVLRAVGVVTDLHLGTPGRDTWGASRSGPLVRVNWFARANATRRPNAADTTWLSVYAVPSELRARTAELLLGGTLDAACRWIKRAQDRPDSAWAGTNHEWRACLRDGVVTVSEQ